jgi:hypothetical protein
MYRMLRKVIESMSPQPKYKVTRIGEAMTRITNQLRHVRDLPNRDGFEFMAVDKHDNVVKCKVIKNSAGIHKVRGMKFADIVGWFPLAKNI